MPQRHPPDAPAFRRQMVELVGSGRTPADLSREFAPTARASWNWVRRSDRDEGRSQTGLRSAERAQRRRLRRENRHVRQERALLAKPAAGSASLTFPAEDRRRRWLARKTDVTASGSSSA
jgi:transposase